MQRTEPRFDLSEPLREPLDLCGRLFGLAAGVDQPSGRFSVFGACFQLDAPRVFGLVTRRHHGGFGRRLLLDRRLFGLPRAIDVRRRLACLLLQSLQLGAPL